MPLFCPFPPARNPATSWAERHTLAWATNWGLLSNDHAYERFATASFAELMGRAYPGAGAGMLATIADWNSWTFLVDTQLDHEALGRDPATLASFAQTVGVILGDRPCPVDPNWPALLRALADVVRRLRIHATGPWLRRFRRNVGDTLTMCVREADHRRRGVRVDEELYCAMRPHTSGVACFLDLIELANRAPLADAVRAHPSVARLAALTTEAIYLANDLASADKERLQGDENNLVLIVERSRGLDAESAQKLVEARHNKVVTAFLLETTSCGGAHLLNDPALGGYVAGLGTWMRANLDWSRLTGRYNAAQLRVETVNSAAGWD